MTIDVQSKRNYCEPEHRIKGNVNRSNEYCGSDDDDDKLISALDTVVWRIPGSSWWRDHPSEYPRHGSEMRYWLRVPHINDQLTEHEADDAPGVDRAGHHWLAKLTVIRKSESVTLGGVNLSPSRDEDTLCIEMVSVIAGTHWKVYWADRSRPVQLIPPSRLNRYQVRQIKGDPLQLSPGVRVSGWVSGHWYGSSTWDSEARSEPEVMHDLYPSAPGLITYNWCFLIPVCMDHLTQITVHLLPPESMSVQPLTPTQFDKSVPVRGQTRAYDKQNRRITKTMTNTTISTGRSNSTTYHTTASVSLSSAINTTATITEQTNKQTWTGRSHSTRRTPITNVSVNSTTLSRTVANTELLPLLPLLEPESRLVLSIEGNCFHMTEAHSNQFSELESTDIGPSSSHSMDQYPIGTYANRDRQDSITEPDSPSELGLDGASNCYTYIRTIDGQPAHINGTVRSFVTPDHSKTTPLVRSGRQLLRQNESDSQCVNSTRNGPLDQNGEHIDKGGLHTIDYTYSLTEPVNGTHRAQSTSQLGDSNEDDDCVEPTLKTYLLKQLDIVNDSEDKDNAPPPWMIKLNSVTNKCPSEYTPRSYPSERSWNTVYTMDSVGSGTSLTPDPEDRGGYFKRTNQERLGSQSGSSVDCDNDAMGDQLQPKRGSLLAELLAELHAFAEYVVYQSSFSTEHETDTAVKLSRQASNTSTVNAREIRLKAEYEAQVVERRKRILSHLTTLCEDEDEEEEEQEEDEYVLDRSGLDDGIPKQDYNRSRSHASSVSGTTAICVPLPKACRIASPMRLVTCYFELLSELADLQTTERKKRLLDTKAQSKLIDLAAAFLRVLSTSPPTSTGRRGSRSPLTTERSKCLFGLYLLHQLGVLLGFTPWSTDRTDGVSKSTYAWFPYTREIKLSLDEHRKWLIRITKREFSDERLASASLESGDSVQNRAAYSQLLDNCRQRLVECLCEGAQDMSWLDRILHSSNGTKHKELDEKTEISKGSATLASDSDLSQNSHETDGNQITFSWDWFLDCCQMEVQFWQKYLDADLHPAIPFSTYSTQADVRNENGTQPTDRDIPIKQWFDDEMAQWHKKLVFIRANCNELTLMAKLLECSQTVNSTDFSFYKRNLIPIVKRDLEQIHKQALDQFILLQFCNQLIHLPDGMQYQISCLQELSEQIGTLENTSLNASTDYLDSETSETVLAASELLIQIKIQLRQLQHRLCLELSFLRSAHTRHSSQLSKWIDKWTAQVSGAYHSLIRRTVIQRTRLQEYWLTQAFNEWIQCAQAWIERIDLALKRTDLLHHEEDECMFRSIWLLLYDAELLQQTYWRANRERLNVIKTKLAPPPTEFTTYLTKVRSYVDRVIAGCEQDPDQIVSLLQSMEQSARDQKSLRVLTLTNNVLLGSVNRTQCPDKLHALVHAVRVHQKSWERRMRLTQRAIDVAANPTLTRGRHAHFVRRWIISVSLRRDWLGKMICSMERIARAGEIVEAERFPIRPLTTFEPRFVADEMLRQEQTFIEAIHYALELHEIESKLVRTGLSICDSQSTGSSASCSLNGILEELKHLYTRMVHDPRLGQTGGTTQTQDKFTAFLQSRRRDAEALWCNVERTSQVDWVVDTSDDHSKTGLAQWLNHMAIRFHLEDTVQTSRICRIEELLRKCDSQHSKTDRIRFAPFTAGFSWTMISFDTEASDLFRRVHTNSNGSSFSVDEKWIKQHLQSALVTLREQSINPSVGSLPVPKRISLIACPTHASRDAVKSRTDWSTVLRTIETELAKPKQKQSDLIYLERILIQLLDLRTQLSPAYLQATDSDQATMPTVSEWIRTLRLVVDQMKASWKDLITGSDSDVEVTAFLRRWSTQLSTIHQSTSSPVSNGLDSNGILDSKEDIVDLLKHAQVFHILLESLCDVLVNLNNKQNWTSQLPFPQWLSQVRQDVNTLFCWLPVTELTTEPNCSDCRLRQIHLVLDMLETEADLASILPVGQNSITQLHALTTWLHLDTQTRPANQVNGSDSETALSLKNWNATMHRIEMIRDQVEVINEACRIYRQLHQFASEVLEQTELMEFGNPVQIEELRAALTALEDDLHRIKLCTSLASSPVEAARQFWLRQIQLLHVLLPPCDTWNPTDRITTTFALESASPYQCLNEILADINRIQSSLLTALIQGLNTHVPCGALGTDPDSATSPRMSYDLSLKLPTDSDLTHMYAQLAHLDHLCHELKLMTEYDQDDMVGLIAQPAGLHVEDPTVTYAINLLNKLHAATICSPAEQKQCVKEALERTEKLHDLVGALSEHMHESPNVEHRLYLALPNLTGRLMDELTKAVDELEARSAQSRLESSLPQQTRSQISDQLKHAGQRLMELETSLEHACESIRFLLLLSIGDRLWSHIPEQRLSLVERGSTLQKDYERSFGYVQLRVAWTQLAQLGDRLGRIQAGLPSRPATDNCFGVWHDEQLTSTNDGTYSSTKFHLLESNETGKDEEQFEQNEEAENADVVRRKRLGLRELLGSHVCVYPECKRAQAEWAEHPIDISHEQLTIVRKIREVFVELVHFYAQLKKELIEKRGPNSRQSVEYAIRHTSHRDVQKSPMTNWHHDVELSSRYRELMAHVNQLSEFQLPQIKKLCDKAKSLETLWYDQKLSTDDLSGSTGRLKAEDFAYPDPKSSSPSIQQHRPERVPLQVGSLSEDERNVDKIDTYQVELEKSNTGTNDSSTPLGGFQDSSPKHATTDLSMLHGIARSHFEKLFANHVGGADSSKPSRKDHHQNGINNLALTVAQMQPLSAIDIMNAARQSHTRKTNRAKQKREKKKRKDKSSLKPGTDEFVDKQNNSGMQQSLERSSERSRSPSVSSLEKITTPEKPDDLLQVPKSCNASKTIEHSKVNLDHTNLLPLNGEDEPTSGVSRLKNGIDWPYDDRLPQLSSKRLHNGNQQLTETQSRLCPSHFKPEPLAHSSPKEPPNLAPISICENAVPLSTKEHIQLVCGIQDAMKSLEEPNQIYPFLHMANSVKSAQTHNNSGMEAQKNTGNVTPMHKTSKLVLDKSDYPTQWIDETADADPSWITVQKKSTRKPKKKSTSKKSRKSKSSNPENEQFGSNDNANSAQRVNIISNSKKTTDYTISTEQPFMNPSPNDHRFHPRGDDRVLEGSVHDQFPSSLLNVTDEQKDVKLQPTTEDITEVKPNAQINQQNISSGKIHHSKEEVVLQTEQTDPAHCHTDYSRDFNGLVRDECNHKTSVIQPSDDVQTKELQNQGGDSILPYTPKEPQNPMTILSSTSSEMSVLVKSSLSKDPPESNSVASPEDCLVLERSPHKPAREQKSLKIASSSTMQMNLDDWSVVNSSIQNVMPESADNLGTQDITQVHEVIHELGPPTTLMGNVTENCTLLRSTDQTDSWENTVGLTDLTGSLFDGKTAKTTVKPVDDEKTSHTQRLKTRKHNKQSTSSRGKRQKEQEEETSVTAVVGKPHLTCNKSEENQVPELQHREKIGSTEPDYHEQKSDSNKTSEIGNRLPDIVGNFKTTIPPEIKDYPQFKKVTNKTMESKHKKGKSDQKISVDVAPTTDSFPLIPQSRPTIETAEETIESVNEKQPSDVTQSDQSSQSADEVDWPYTTDSPLSTEQLDSSLKRVGSNVKSTNAKQPPDIIQSDQSSQSVADEEEPHTTDGSPSTQQLNPSLKTIHATVESTNTKQHSDIIQNDEASQFADHLNESHTTDGSLSTQQLDFSLKTTDATIDSTNAKQHSDIIQNDQCSHFVDDVNEFHTTDGSLSTQQLDSLLKTTDAIVDSTNTKQLSDIIQSDESSQFGDNLNEFHTTDGSLSTRQLDPSLKTTGSNVKSTNAKQNPDIIQNDQSSQSVADVDESHTTDGSLSTRQLDLSLKTTDAIVDSTNTKQLSDIIQSDESSQFADNLNEFHTTDGSLSTRQLDPSLKTASSNVKSTNAKQNPAIIQNDQSSQSVADVDESHTTDGSLSTQQLDSLLKTTDAIVDSTNTKQLSDVIHSDGSSQFADDVDESHTTDSSLSTRQLDLSLKTAGLNVKSTTAKLHSDIIQSDENSQFADDVDEPYTTDGSLSTQQLDSLLKTTDTIVDSTNAKQFSDIIQCDQSNSGTANPSETDQQTSSTSGDLDEDWTTVQSSFSQLDSDFSNSNVTETNLFHTMHLSQSAAITIPTGKTVVMDKAHNEREEEEEEEDEFEKIPTLFEELSISPDDKALSYSGLTDLDEPCFSSTSLMHPPNRRDRIHLHPIIEQPSDQSTFEDELLNGVVDDIPTTNHAPLSDDTTLLDQSRSLMTDKPQTATTDVKAKPSISYIGTRKIRKARRRLQPGQRSTNLLSSSYQPNQSLSHSEAPTNNEGYQLSENHAPQNMPTFQENKIIDSLPPNVQDLSERQPMNQPLHSVSELIMWEEVDIVSDSHDTERLRTADDIPRSRLSLAVQNTAISLMTAASEPVTPILQPELLSTTKQPDQSTGPNFDLNRDTQDQITSDNPHRISEVKSTKDSECAVHFVDKPQDHTKSARVQCNTTIISTGEPGGTPIDSSSPTESIINCKSEQHNTQPQTTPDKAKSTKSRKNCKLKKEETKSATNTESTHEKLLYKPEDQTSGSSNHINASDKLSSETDSTKVAVSLYDSLQNKTDFSDAIKSQSTLRHSPSTFDRFVQTSVDDGSAKAVIYVKNQVNQTDHEIHEELNVPRRQHVRSVHCESQTVKIPWNGRHKMVQTERCDLKDCWTLVGENYVTQAVEAKDMGATIRRTDHRRLQIIDDDSERVVCAGKSPRRPVRTCPGFCSRYLWPLLGLLLLLLLFLWFVCLFLIPKCGSGLIWTHCVENTVFWRYLYHPLGLARIRRPPL